MTPRELKRKMTGQWRRQCLGALLTTVVGLLVYWSRLGQGLDHWSFDLLTLFGAKPAPEDIILVRMGEEAHQELKQRYGQEWDRGLHARLLQRLAADKAKLVVFDVFFTEPGNAVTNQLFADAIRAQGKVILAGDLREDEQPGIVPGTIPLPPLGLFRDAAAAWGISHVDPDFRYVIRHFYERSEVVPSLAWAAASFMQAPVTKTNDRPSFFRTERWIRYYNPEHTFTDLSYDLALTRPSDYFRDKIVFIGGSPRIGFVAEKKDEFATPFTRWNRTLVAGVEVHATMLLNLLHGDWLTRLATRWELLLVFAWGIAFGIGLNLGRLWLSTVVGLLAALFVAFACLLVASQHHVWFGWLTISGVEVPCALVLAMLARRRQAVTQLSPEEVSLTFAQSEKRTCSTTQAELAPLGDLDGSKSDKAESTFDRLDDRGPPISGHTLLQRIGGGAYGEVWLARDVIGSFHAVKVIRRERFSSAEPFEREFRGMQKFTPISRSHPGFVHVLHVDRNDSAGYFYYIMEPADDELTGPQIDPLNYHPKTLAGELAKRKRVPVEECLWLGLSLAAALEYLHEQHLIHRDLKPSNIIFVQGKPKLADIGLVTESGRPAQHMTYVGTRGYMAPEGPGTIAADVYSLGKVLYEAAMGLECEKFPEMPNTLVEHAAEMGSLLDLNEVILKACSPLEDRYRSARELHAALKLLKERVQN